MFINEIYFDPPGMGDLVFEYIELRGTPGASLADHYLVFLENESSATSNAGAIEAYFDLGSLAVPSFGANGFLTLRQTGNVYTDLNPQSNNPQNTTDAFGWGINGSDVGWADEPGGTFDGIIENSGFTAMLIQNNGGPNSAPAITAPLIDLDQDDDAMLDSGTILDDWTVLDSIGVNAEASDISGFLYAPSISVLALHWMGRISLPVPPTLMWGMRSNTSAAGAIARGPPSKIGTPAISPTTAGPAFKVPSTFARQAIPTVWARRSSMLKLAKACPTAPYSRTRWAGRICLFKMATTTLSLTVINSRSTATSTAVIS